MGQLAKGNIQKYFITTVLYGFCLSVPIVVLYYQSFGLSYLQLTLLESIYLFTILLFEIPTGVIADKFGRKTTLLIGALVLPIATVITGLSHSFGVFAITSIIYGIAISMFSGAEAALVYDTLKEDGEEKAYLAVNGKSAALMYLCMAIAAPIGAHLFVTNRSLPFFIDAGITVLAFFIYSSMREPIIEDETKEDEKNFFTILKSGATSILSNKLIMWYIMFATLISVVLTVFNSAIGQPFIVAQGVPVAQIGYIFLATSLVQAVVAFYAEKIENKFGEKKTLLFIVLAIGLSLLAIRIPILLVIIPFYLIFTFTKSYQFLVLENYLQKHIKSSTRATVLSVQSFVMSLVGVVLLPVFGYIIDVTSILNSVVILGLMILIFGGLLIYFKPRTI